MVDHSDRSEFTFNMPVMHLLRLADAVSVLVFVFFCRRRLRLLLLSSSRFGSAGPPAYGTAESSWGRGTLEQKVPSPYLHRNQGKPRER